MTQTVIVTGVSSGVGAATATAFANRGDHVFGLARHASSRDDLAALGVTLIDTDLSQDTSVADAMNRIKAQTQTIDILAHVAGMAINGAVEDITIAQAEAQFQVNVFGIARLTKAVLPFMRRQQSGHIIVVSSSAVSATYPLMGWYAGSKRAIEGVMDALRMEVKSFNIQVSLIEPGGIDTPMTQIEPSFNKTSGHGAYRDLAAHLTRLFSSNQATATLQSPEDVAHTIVQVSRTQKPKTRYVTGRGTKALMRAYRLFPDRLLDTLTLKIINRT